MKHLFTLLIIAQYSAGFGQVTLNEMQSSNNTTLSDDEGEFDDWIEIYNPTSEAIEIGGLILKDQLDTWMIPTGDPLTLVPPGGYFLLWADDQEEQGIFHTNFKLASGGEFLGLYESDGVTVVDSITLPEMTPDESYARCASSWIQTNAPTPLAENDCTAGITENEEFNALFSIIVMSKNQLAVSILGDFENLPSLAIYSIDGKKVLTQSLNNKKTIINTNALNDKVYILTLTTATAIYSKKIALVN